MTTTTVSVENALIPQLGELPDAVAGLTDGAAVFGVGDQVSRLTRFATYWFDW